MRRRSLAGTVLAMLSLAVPAEAQHSDDAGQPEARALFEEARRLEALGELPEALFKAEDALDRWRSAPGENQLQIARCLSLVGELYYKRKRYAQAEPFLQQGLSLLAPVLGDTHPDVAATATVLGDVLYAQRQFEQAARLYTRGFEIRKLILSNSRLDRKADRDRAAVAVADSATRLGLLHVKLGQGALAKQMFERALAVRAQIGGERGALDVTESIKDLAALAQSDGDNGAAEAMLQRVLNLRVAALSEQHPSVADAFSRLGSFYLSVGRYGNASEALARAHDIYPQSQGKSRAALGALLIDRALAELGQGNVAWSLSIFRSAIDISTDLLQQGTIGAAESDLEDLLRDLEKGQQHLYTLACEEPRSDGAAELALTAALLFRGWSIHEAVANSRSLIQDLKPEDRYVAESLQELRAQYARLALDGPGQIPPLDYQQLLQQVADERDALEAALSKRLAASRASLPAPDTILKRVAAELPLGSAFVQFVAYGGTPLPNATRCVGQRYLALVLLPDESVYSIDLGPALAIDKATTLLRVKLQERGSDAYVSYARELHDLLFLKLQLPKGTKKLFIVPDGQLLLVPFAVLYDGIQFLVESVDITYLSSGIDLLPRRPVASPPSSVVIFADPDLGRAKPPPPASAIRDASSGATECSSGPAPPLEWTKKEADDIIEIFGVAAGDYKHGPAASKKELLQITAPAVLHIATHGFFQPDRCGGDGRTVAKVDSLNRPIPELPDPLLRSGLMLAGGSGELGDSLVTAMELAELNLWGTQLVVLSACNTGRGEVEIGQGVYGLRRSLFVAGAETVVVSLWRVDDEYTRELMKLYYQNLHAGQGRVTALTEAMRVARSQSPGKHPYYWAPFIAIGRDAPLRFVAAKP